MSATRELNQTALRQLKPSIDRTYPCGRFVAIDGGQVVADCADLSELERTLREAGKDSREILVVQAGHEYPEYVDLLLSR